MWSFITGLSNRGFPALKEETEESSDDDDQRNPGSDQNYNQDGQATPNFGTPTFDLSCDQGCDDVESQQNVDCNVLDQAQSTDNDDITGDSSEDSPVVVSPQAHNFRNIRRTMSGALEVYGAVGVSVVARSSPHMQRRQSPHVPSQESSMYATAVWCVHYLDIIVYWDSS